MNTRSLTQALPSATALSAPPHDAAAAGAATTQASANASALRRAPAAARAVLALLQRLPVGTLELKLPDGSVLHCGQAQAGAPQASLSLRNWRPCSAALRSGDIGFAQTYIDGDWQTPDLSGLLRLLLANRGALDQAIYGHWWGRLLHRLRHLLNRNSRAGSRRNIHAHYDLGNLFYSLWLDETMNYSSAWFDGDLNRSLAEAQQAKLQRALQQCALQPGQRLLEIGCGWGALAEHAAGQWGAHVTGITLSTEQLAYAQRRLARAGLAERAELRLQDYRDLRDGPYDAIASIEMIEAVGRAWWPRYFQALHDQLKPGGRACIQSIVIDDALFERYAAGTDFIQQYIFPGGLMPSRQQLQQHALRAGLQPLDELAFGADYAETLRRWRASFTQQEKAVRALGYDTRFIRTWTFYLAYCEAAFDSGSIDVVQWTLQRPADTA